MNHANEPYAMYPDNCERCAGMMGGVRGNENRHIEDDGFRVLCDYCSVEVDSGLDRDIICNDCHRPLSAHVVMKIEQVESIWAQGIALTTCGDVSSHDWEPIGVLVAMEDDKPDDPCDEEFMKEISS